MGFVRVHAKSDYYVDWAEVERITVPFAYLKALIQNATLDTEKQSFMGSMKVVNFDHKKVRQAKQQNINNVVPWVVQTMSTNPAQAQQILARLKTATDDLKAQRATLFGEAEKSFQGYDRWTGLALGGMQAARDVGFATVAIIGAPLGGTVALSAVALSSAGAAWGKYQDTGNKDAALLSGIGALVMCGSGVVQGLAKATGAAKGILIGGGIVMDMTFEAAGASVEGKSGSEALKSALLKGITAGLGTAVDATKIGSKIDDVLGNMAQTWKTVMTKEHGQKVGLEVVKKGAEKGVNYAASDDYGGPSAPSALKSATPANLLYVKNNVLKKG